MPHKVTPNKKWSMDAKGIHDGPSVSSVMFKREEGLSYSTGATDDTRSL